MKRFQIVRKIERAMFSAQLGALAAVILLRLVYIFTPINRWAMVAVVLVGMWTGAFLSSRSMLAQDALVDSLRDQTSRLRAICLKVMLWLLGAAAVIGVLVVLTASYDVLGRIAGTILITAIAMGLLWPLSLLVDRQKTLAAGLLGMATVVALYLMILPMIWIRDTEEEKVLLTCIVVGLSAPAGMTSLLMMHFDRTKFAGRLGVALYMAAVAVFFVAIWHHTRSIGEEWGTRGGWLSLYGILAIACAAGLYPLKLINWRWIGVIASAAAFILTEFIELRIDWQEVLLWVVTSIPVATAHASVLQFIPLPRSQAWLRIATVGAGIVTALLVDAILVLDYLEAGAAFASDWPMRILERVTAAGGVVVSCGTLALLVLAGLHSRRETTMVDGEIHAITLFCPRCGKKQTLPLGGAACEKCGLEIDVNAAPNDGDWAASLKSPG